MSLLSSLQSKSSRIVIGLMSGTSCDGIDAALCKITNFGLKTKVKLLHFESYPYETSIRNRLMEIFQGKGNAEEICRLNFDIGESFAQAALSLLEKANFPSKQVDLIGSHGQTIFHAPPHSTLQIGEPDLICERTGIPTIADFRTRDVAAGGQGAPLVSYVDYLLFQAPGKNRALHNLGGIGNVTLIAQNPEKVLAFDTGPANVLIDWAVSQMTKGEQWYDPGGKLAAQGELSSSLLEKLMQHSYFKEPLPKTTGREMFNGASLAEILPSFSKLSWNDIITTLTHFTVESMWDQYQKFLPPNLDEILLSGGGVENTFLFELIRKRFLGISVKSTEDFGFPSDGKEAMAFAVLANEAICGQTTNLPSVTGASQQVILGKLSFTLNLFKEIS